MKYSGLIFIFAAVLLVFSSISVQKANARTSVEISNNGQGASSNINVNTNTGGNTICVNGKCTTTDNNSGKSTVCINGKCQTSEDGNLDMQSEDGNSKVHINNSSKQEVNINNSTNSAEEIKKEVRSRIEKLKKNIKTKTASTSAKKFDIKEFFKSELSFLRDLATFKFLFGSK